MLLNSREFKFFNNYSRFFKILIQFLSVSVPLGETNEEFYQGIYTGQPFVPRLQSLPPPLPLEPPAWQRPGPSVNREEREEPSWACRMCTFNNHALMRRCEQCNLHRILPVASGRRRIPGSMTSSNDPKATSNLKDSSRK